MRGAFHLGVVATLMLAFSQAPFSHTHESDPHHEHAQGLVHTHSKGHASSGPAWRDRNSDTRSLEWLLGDGKSPVRLAAALPETVALPEPAVQPSLVPDLTAHNHDPPWRLSLKSRASCLTRPSGALFVCAIP